MPRSQRRVRAASPTRPDPTHPAPPAPPAHLGRFPGHPDPGQPLPAGLGPGGHSTLSAARPAPNLGRSPGPARNTSSSRWGAAARNGAWGAKTPSVRRTRDKELESRTTGDPQRGAGVGGRRRGVGRRHLPAGLEGAARSLCVHRHEGPTHGRSAPHSWVPEGDAPTGRKKQAPPSRSRRKTKRLAEEEEGDRRRPGQRLTGKRQGVRGGEKRVKSLPPKAVRAPRAAGPGKDIRSPISTPSLARFRRDLTFMLREHKTRGVKASTSRPPPQPSELSG